MKDKSDRIVIKIFKKGGREKRVHNCYLCQIYKREAAKGDMDALVFYKNHLNEVVRKYEGATIVLNAASRPRALPSRRK